MARIALLFLLAALFCAAPASAAVAPHGDEIPPGADAVLASTSGAATASALAGGSWCGEELGADDVVHQAAVGNAIKVVYARTAGAPNRFADYASVIQGDIKAVADAFLTATDGVKSVRFDLGTGCGATYVDVQSVQLPRTRDAYLAMDFNTRFNTLGADLKPLVAGSPWCATVNGFAPNPCTRDFLVYADGLYNDDWTTGVATRRTDDSAGAGNASNRGGLFAYVLGNGSAQFGLSSATTAQHELLHNLGAVQNAAPHSTLAGHCFDEVDVMCYPDGGPLGTTMLQSCPLAAESTIDCGNDDYFNPGGPVLGTSHQPIWNVYDSAFLCPAAACGAGAPGPQIASVPGPSAAAPAPQPPAATPVKPTPVAAPRDPLAGLAQAVQSQIGRLLAGRAVRVTIRPATAGRFTVRLMLGGRAVASASARARAGQRVDVTLRLSGAIRRRLARASARVRVRLAFTQ